MSHAIPASGHMRSADPAVVVPVSVRSRLDSLVRSDGDRAAYLDAGSGERVTWMEVARQAVSWAANLPPGAVVALRASNPAAFCRAYLAGLAAGVCVAPVDPRASASELSGILDVLEATDVVVDNPAAAGQLTGPDATTWIASADGLRLVRRSRASRLLAPGVAALLTTSGTTGQPKIVPLTRQQVLRVAALVARHHGLTRADRGYCPLPLFHVNAQVVGVLSTLVAGSCLVVDDRFHASRFWRVAEEFKVTWLNLVPAIIGILAESPTPTAAVSRRIKFARSASAPLPVAVSERFTARTGIGVLETYGMTEAASQIAANPLPAGERRAGSAGRPAGVRVRVVGSDRRELPAGETGAVEIRGRTVTDVYLGRGRTLIAARAPDGWLRTGDVGFADPSGYLYLAGRSDDVINRGGEKFHPREIEEVLLGDPRVRNAAVVGRPHPLLGEEPVAYVVVTGEVDRGDLIARCSRELSPYKRPVSVVVMDALPVGPAGKIDRRALRAHLAHTA
jgi:oxalate---CoA ligase